MSRRLTNAEVLDRVLAGELPGTWYDRDKAMEDVVREVWDSDYPHDPEPLARDIVASLGIKAKVPPLRAI